MLRDALHRQPATSRSQPRFPGRAGALLTAWHAASLLLASGAQAQTVACEQLKTVLAGRIEATGVRGYSLEAVPVGEPTPPDAKVIGQCSIGTYKVLYRRWASTEQKPDDAAAPGTAASAPQAVAAATAASRAPAPAQAAGPAAAQTPTQTPRTAVPPPAPVPVQAAAPAPVQPPAPRPAAAPPTPSTVPIPAPAPAPALVAVPSPAISALAVPAPAALPSVATGLGHDPTSGTDPARQLAMGGGAPGGSEARTTLRPSSAERTSMPPTSVVPSSSGRRTVVDFMVRYWLAVAVLLVAGGIAVPWLIRRSLYDKDGLPRGPKVRV